MSTARERNPQRMSGRLYPGFGSGTGELSLTVKVSSVTSAGRSDLECGDKALLPAVRRSPARRARVRASAASRARHTSVRLTHPQSAFKAITRARLPYPLVFTVMSERAAHARDEA